MGMGPGVPATMKVDGGKQQEGELSKTLDMTARVMSSVEAQMGAIQCLLDRLEPIACTAPDQEKVSPNGILALAARNLARLESINAELAEIGARLGNSL